MISIFRVYVPLTVIFLLAFDAIILLFSISIGYELSFTPFDGDDWQGHFLRRSLFAAVLLTTAFGMGLHQRQYIRDPVQTILRQAASFGIGLLALIIIFYIVPASRIWQSALAPGMLIAFVGMILARTVYRRLADIDLFKRRIAVIGTGRRAVQIEELASAARSSNFLCLGYIPDSSSAMMVDKGRLLDFGDSLSRFAKERNISEIVLACEPPAAATPPHRARRALHRLPSGDGALALLDEDLEPQAADEMTDAQAFPPMALSESLVRQLLGCRLAGIKIIDHLSFMEREQGEVDLNFLRSNWLLLGDGFSSGRPGQRLVKRGFDIVVASILLLLVLPFMALVALAILIGDRGPILYRQERVGLHNKAFRLLKFRSMRVDAEKDGIAKWAMRNDPRVTRVGAFLRRTRLDELPQLINVLRGDMSFVGPRPERPVFVKKLMHDIPFYEYRHSVKPGITGWAQINFDYGSSIDDARRKLQFDLYYIKNYSLFLDMMIVVQTTRVILWPPDR